jgi:hypothetical protein
MTRLPRGWRAFPILSYLFICPMAFCQKQPVDSAYLVAANKYAFDVYIKSIGDQAGLYNGVEHKGYLEHNTDIGHPYFLSNDWVDGSVFYDGAEYENTGLLYDLLTDKVIVEQPYGHFKLELISEKIKTFSLAGHTFVRLTASKGDSTVRPGFYDLLYDGKVKVLAKHTVEIVQKMDFREIIIEYLRHEKIFIFKDGEYFAVKSRSSVLKVFDDRKKELRKFINKNQIDFSSDREHAVARIAKFYDMSKE